MEVATAEKRRYSEIGKWPAINRRLHFKSTWTVYTHIHFDLMLFWSSALAGIESIQRKQGPRLSRRDDMLLHGGAISRDRDSWTSEDAKAGYLLCLHMR